MSEDRLSLVFAALADARRREILERLGDGPATVGELAAPLPISAPAVSRHLRVLERAGLVDRTVDSQWRTITARARALDPAQLWVQEQQRRWNARFDNLDEVLADLGGPNKGEKDDRIHD